MTDPGPHPEAGLIPPAFWTPEYLVDSAWHEHAPFAFWVVATHRPRVLVELGTHFGFSYMAFCQAVERLDIGTRCYAVDTWQGDEHAGFYGEDVFEQFRSDHDALYRSFSTLLRTTFSEAARHFDDGSIDLLHIDGAHHLDDVTEDFTTWLPKMSERGVILFHDINVHRDDFGVYALWGRIKDDYPHFSFDHGHGLGVLGVGPESIETLGGLFAAEGTPRATELRRVFARLGEAIHDRRTIVSLEMESRTLRQNSAETAKHVENLMQRLSDLTQELADRTQQLAELRAESVGVHRELAIERSRVSQQASSLRDALASRDSALAEVRSLRTSTSWRVTAPLRILSRALRRVGRFTRRGFKVVWWTVTLQLPRRLRAYRQYRSGASGTQATMASEAARSGRPGPDFEAEPIILDASTPAAKVVAFYLPQFHRIPENDAWWGPGFTEWRNVSRGLPRFVGHNQPLAPRDFGYYDLADPKVLHRQVDAAKAAGIHAFCFYYYRFTEGRLLEMPTERLLADPSIDMPFCLMWANENWTRTWDGLDNEVLRGHTFDAAMEDGLLDDLIRHFADRRYLRLGGRPVFIIYRPGLIPGGRAAFDRWRERLITATGERPLLLMAQAFDDYDPRPFGLDGAIEFPPHKLAAHLPERRDEYQLLDPDYGGSVRSYDDLVEASRDEPVPTFDLIRGVVPSWDNEARRPGRGLTFAGSSPREYEQWLREAIRYSRAHPVAGESLVFVNAWNEWAEGAYLEPDAHHGWAYLNATARAVFNPLGSGEQRKLLVVGHDAAAHGAQTLLLDIITTLARTFGVQVRVLLLDGGPFLERYRAVAPTTVIGPGDPDWDQVVDRLGRQGFTSALTSTVVSGPAVEALKGAGFDVTALVHEMGSFIADRGWGEAAAATLHADRIVFPDEFVARRFTEAVGAAPARTVVCPQGLRGGVGPAGDRDKTRAGLGASSASTVVIGVGYGDLRKGFDLFVEAARRSQDRRDLLFVWVGGIDPAVREWFAGPDSKPNNLTLIDFTAEVGRYYEAADVLFLASREDAFPSTVLEALSFGLPVVGFRDSSGTGDLIERTGRLVDRFDLDGVLAAITEVTALSVADKDHAAAERRNLISRDHRHEDYVFDLLRLAHPDLQRISVVVPNFNYARYLPGRIESVFGQTYPVLEVIVLDDASTDDSLEVLEDLGQRLGRDLDIVRADRNSGSVFRQWLKAAQRARGDLLWIAEADDQCSPRFLELVAELATTPTVALAFSDSSQIDGDGRKLGDSYRFYLDAHGGTRFTTDFRMNGVEFRERYLRVRNLILNTSGVLFRRELLLDALERNMDDLVQLRFAGDWLMYAELCSLGDVAYVNQPLNVHRRHSGTTLSTKPEVHVAEIARVHEMLNRRFGATPQLLTDQQAYLAEALASLTSARQS